MNRRTMRMHPDRLSEVKLAEPVFYDQDTPWHPLYNRASANNTHQR